MKEWYEYQSSIHLRALRLAYNDQVLDNYSKRNLQKLAKEIHKLLTGLIYQL